MSECFVVAFAGDSVLGRLATAEQAGAARSGTLQGSRSDVQTPHADEEARQRHAP